MDLNVSSSQLNVSEKPVSVAEKEQLLTTAIKLANVFLVTGGCACLLVVLYCLYHYVWIQDRVFTSAFGSLLYYGSPTGLAVGLLAALWLPAEHKLNLALLGVSTTLALYGAESVLEAYELMPGHVREVRLAPLHYATSYLERKRVAASVKRDFGVDIDMRSAGEVVADLRQRGITASLAPFSINELLRSQPDGSRRSLLTVHGQELLPLTGPSHQLQVVCNENGRWVTVHSDEHGFANPLGLWQQPRLDIAALGDSYTHGYCVAPEDNFVARIRQQKPATVNLGVSDIGPLVELAILKEYVSPFKAPVVLWFYYEGNDLSDLQREKRSPLLLRYLEAGFTQGLLGRQHAIDQALQDPGLVGKLMRERATAWEQIQQRQAPVSSALRRGLKLGLLRQKLSLVYGDEHLSENNELFCRILAHAQEEVQGWGGQLSLVYLPSWGRYGANAPGVLGEQYPHVLECARRLELPLIDLEPVFAAHRDVLSLFPFREPGHYTEAGHQLVADEVLKVLSAR